MKKLTLNIYYWLMFVIATLLFFLLLPLFLLVAVIFLRKKVDAVVRQGIVIYGWVLVKIVPFFAPVQVEYRSGKLPLPVILVANHSSAIDPYLFGALLIDVCFVSTWPFRIPGYGYCMRLANYVDANQGWDKVCQQGAELLQSGTSLIIWPEGHRSRDGNLGRFKNGAFALSVRTGYPILPVCIIGTRQFLPPGKKGVLSPSQIKMFLLDPIYPQTESDEFEEIIRIREKAKAAIEENLQLNGHFISHPTPQNKILKEASNVNSGEECF